MQKEKKLTLLKTNNKLIGEKMKKFIYLTILILIFEQCGTLIPREVRQTELVKESSLKKKELFDIFSIYLAKNLVNSNHAIKIKDENSGRIVTQFRSDCFFKSAFPFNKQYIEANIDFTAKDNKYRLIFDDIQLIVDNGQGTKLFYPKSISEFEELKKECIFPIQNEILKSLDSSTNKVNSDF